MNTLFSIFIITFTFLLGQIYVVLILLKRIQDKVVESKDLDNPEVSKI